MRAGQQSGGKVATPVRDMLESLEYNSVIFHCEDDEHAETIRMDALMLRWRYRYPYKTSRKGNRVIVYKDGYEYEPNCFEVKVTRGD